MTMLTVGLVQMCSTNVVAQNIAAASRLIRKAHARGAHFVLTPEMTGLFESRRAKILALAKPERTDPALKALRALARELRIWLLIGSLPVQAGQGKLFNRSYLAAPSGKIAARYDKIHMFDVNLSSGQVYRESKTYRAGKKAAVAKMPFAKAGLSVCYDLRFPHLYRALAQKGADILCVPSAFTAPTGKAHWEVLLRARAIENGAFVLAPAQAGRHADGRGTYGHSLIVDPWGRVMADAGAKREAVITATLDLSAAAAARRKIPSLRVQKAVS
ncbi:MAG TPA: carbon-nitrogen hydrolase family protein [Sphingomonadales bacterium]|nr:carbon-nitrogen hydrolase family protein [Sphingomonadales bacterium]